MQLPFQITERLQFVPEPPFDRFSKGVCWIHKKMFRRMVNLYNTADDNTTMSLARYLYQVFLWKTDNYIIPKELTVDHINDDKFDDRLDNYQLLTQSQNSTKAGLRQGKKYVVLVCPNCKHVFMREIRQTQLMPCFKNRVSCCSRACSGSFSGQVPKLAIKWLSKRQVVCVFKESFRGVEILPEYTSDEDYSFMNLIKEDEFKRYYTEFSVGKPKDQTELIEKIRHLFNDGLSDYKIAERLGLRRGKVQWLRSNHISV